MNTNRKKNLTGAIILGILYVLPIILANRYYHDDVPEVIFLSPVWMGDGRPLTDLVIRLLCGANNYIYDMFPLTIILTVVVIMFMSTKWAEVFYECDSPISIIVTFLPLSMGFFLSNLSYRFDCIGYAMSIAFLMLPFLIEYKVTGKKLILNTLCVLASMCFYQGTVGMYIGLVIIVIFIKCIRNEKPFEDVISQALSVITAAVLYKIVIASIFVDNKGWRSDAASFGSIRDIPSRVVSKIYDILMFIWLYLRSLGAREFALYLLILLLGAVATYLFLSGRSRITRILIVLFYCALIPLVFLASVLPVSILDYNSAAAQHLPQLMSLMFVISVNLVMISRKWPRLALVLGLLIVLFRFSFSYAYGNILRVQKEYADFTAQSIVRDIEELDNGSIEEIVIEGEMPYSPIAKNLFGPMPILREMIPAGIDNDGMLNGALINHYYPRMLDFIGKDQRAIRHESSSGTPVISNLVYDIYLEKTRVYVRFK